INRFGRTRLELKEAVIDRMARSIERRARCVEARVEPFRGTFGAIDECLGGGCTAQHCGSHHGSRERKPEFHYHPPCNARNGGSKRLWDIIRLTRSYASYVA